MAEMSSFNADQARMQKNCEGCFYYSGWSCDYIIIEKKHRPCRPGDECTVRKKRGFSGSERLAVIRGRNRLPPRPAPNPTKKPYTVQVKYPRPVTHQKNVNKKTIFDQTKKPKPPKKPKVREHRNPKAKVRLTFEEITDRLERPDILAMYEAGASDADIGKAVGCCANSVRKWRGETGRPVLSRTAPQQGHKVLFDRLDEIKADLAANQSDYALCRKYGVSQRTFARFRVKYNLGPARGMQGAKEHGNEG